MFLLILHQKPSLPLLKRDAVDNLEGWTDSLAQLKLDRKSGEAAMTTMTQNVAARMESKLRKSALSFVPHSEHALKQCFAQMTFLYHFSAR